MDATLTTVSSTTGGATTSSFTGSVFFDTVFFVVFFDLTTLLFGVFVLSALTIVSYDARSAMSWLFQSANVY